MIEIQDFPDRGGANTKAGCTNIIIWPKFSKNYVKMKEFGLTRRVLIFLNLCTFCGA